ncbi:hypothetical protein CU044_2464 [Streptomyces sp. L-9-10]|uniref:hypothetical protein n=1 Tax=unclassified Streptomyces TaxID=2593676 RepID=UPI0010F409C4|nr:hypothetical protein [Streptomyces sp. L-9-10]RYJ29021.1 hypothetical protein CU044_2464 [Streptomyces sp. L-9-10]
MGDKKTDETVLKPKDVHATSTGGENTVKDVHATGGEATTQGDVHATGEPV